MKFSIIDKVTKDKFIGIFQLLKNITSIISFIFKDDYIHIQGMDSGHICLFDINLPFNVSILFNILRLVESYCIIL